MPLRLSGLILVAAGVIFALCGLISGSGAYYGLALMSVGAGLLLVVYKPRKKSANGRRTRKKGKFQA
ncbi:MAG: hypothetical protein E7432_06170 [Ruminococcaceae bacterium]|nr:hypothetical protein [Oscillospiraceae bacterium]